ncbi:hypothetical protein [Arthrobacter psychrochitiniphilus]|uniref:hypothetical protein n=1 Tax=Arthrobacter psychrochitiniphilus TaxID=291045 RepID=UPI003F7C3114
MGTFTDAVTMECSPEGEPLRLWWHGLLHEVIAPPMNWYQRRPWWTDQRSLRPGEGVGYVDVQIWRLQVLREDEAESLTMDVVLYRPSLRWRVMKVHARVPLAAKEAQELVSAECANAEVLPVEVAGTEEWFGA